MDATIRIFFCISPFLKECKVEISNFNPYKITKKKTIILLKLYLDN